jgi:hypothetical protein
VRERGRLKPVLHAKSNPGALRDAILCAIEQILAPIGVAAAEIAHDLPIYVEAERLRSFEQAHTDLLGQ